MPLPTALEGRLRLPVVAAPMFLASGPDLVIGACRAGVLGTFPALNQRTAEGFEQWLDQIEAALTPQDAPYGVNLIVHSSNRRLREDLATIVRHQVPVVITSLGAAAEVVEAVHSYGGLVFHDVTNARFAAKAAAAGVDGIIAVSAGAGGHAGDRNPFALVAEIRSVWDGPLLLSGCLSTGADVLGALAMGADLAYLGTRFLATAEAIAPAEHKAMVVASGAGDVVYTPSISSVPANFLRRSISDAGLDPDNLPLPDRVDLDHLTDPSAAKAWKDVFSAGQGVQAIHDVPPVAELVDRLEREYQDALDRLPVPAQL